MALRDEWDEARRAEASGMPTGTRSTYLEWLMERMVLGQRASLRLLVAMANVPDGEVEDAGAEDEDGADTK